MKFHISGNNYDMMKASLIKQAASLKSRVDSKDIQLDIEFEGTMKKLFAKEVEAAQAARDKKALMLNTVPRLAVPPACVVP